MVALAAPKGEEVGFPAGERFEVYVESPAEVMILTTPGAAYLILEKTGN